MERQILTELFAKEAALVVLLSVLLTPRSAAAESEPAPPVVAAPRPVAPPRASLVVTRGEGSEDCPDATSLAEQVQRVAGANLIIAGTQGLPGASTEGEEPRAETWIQVAITRGFGGYRAEINAAGRHHGTRTLEDLGPGCSSLTDAVVITIAIFLDPYSSAPARRPEPPSNAVAPAAAPAKTRGVLPRHSPLRVTFDLSGGMSFGALAQAAPLFGARVGFRVSDRFSVAGGGTFVFPDTVNAQGGTVDLGLSLAFVIACGRSLGEGAGAHLDWCVAPLFGSLSGVGHGYRVESKRSALWAAVAAGPELILPLTGAFAWTLSAQAALPLRRPGFDVEGSNGRQSAFKAPAAAGAVALGVRGEL